MMKISKVSTNVDGALLVTDEDGIRDPGSISNWKMTPPFFILSISALTTATLAGWIGI